MPDQPITVCIVEDQLETREALVGLLERHSGFRCIGTYATGEEAIRAMSTRAPDVALVDIKLPGMSGIECVAKLKGLHQTLQILIVTTYEESDLIFDSLRAGAKGYILKSDLSSELITAIEQVHAGGAPMSMQIARKVVDHFCQIEPKSSDIEKLTKREHEVLTLLAQGYHYKEISDRLAISFSTVRTHLEHIYEKLHVQSRTEAAVKFLRNPKL
jgi:DNA-binding NarL/FixJ family response regulator